MSEVNSVPNVSSAALVSREIRLVTIQIQDSAISFPTPPPVAPVYNELFFPPQVSGALTALEKEKLQIVKQLKEIEKKEKKAEEIARKDLLAKKEPEHKIRAMLSVKREELTELMILNQFEHVSMSKIISLKKKAVSLNF